MMYHKCQKTQFKKSTKRLKEKKVGRAQSPIPKILLGWNNNTDYGNNAYQGAAHGDGPGAGMFGTGDPGMLTWVSGAG